jgi:hypothetical protein
MHHEDTTWSENGSHDSHEWKNVSHSKKKIHQPVKQTIATISTVHPLDDMWTMWYHDLVSTDFSLKSYVKIFSFNTIEDFWIMSNNIENIGNGMYFLMREGYLPIWEDPKHKNGGSWSFKIDMRKLSKFWQELSCHCIGETICNNSKSVIGLSVSPKISSVIVRVWTSNTNQTDALYHAIEKSTMKSPIQIDFKKARFNKNTPQK